MAPSVQIVTLAQLQITIYPLVSDYPWARAAIDDLWQTGTPVPGKPGTEERRILFPSKFRSWWGEVQKRMGYTLPGDVIYTRTGTTRPTPRARAAVRAWIETHGRTYFAGKDPRRTG